MNTKEIYSKPETEIINIEIEGVVASSIQGYDDDEHTVNGAGRSKKFWGNEQ